MSVVARVAAACSVATALTAALILVPSVPRQEYGYPPVELVVTDNHGEAKSTGISALTVPLQDAPAWTYILAQWIPSIPWVTAPEQFASGAGDSQQESARLAAWFAANVAIGRHIDVGALISGEPAEPFKDGDVLLQVDGVPVLGGNTAKSALTTSDCPPMRTARIMRDQHKMTVEFHCGYFAAGLELMSVGTEQPPWGVPAIDGVKGPSVGLALALAYVDAMTPGSLAGGRRIAATGQVEARLTRDGSQVTGVGSIPAKMQAARAANVDVVLVPRDQVELARLHAGTTPVVGVDSVAEAIDYLCATGATSEICKRHI